MTTHWSTPRSGRIRNAWLLAWGLAAVFAAQAQKVYGPGVTDTEIKIGNIAPYSGPASSYGTIGKAAAAYFAKVNAEGGINGRKLRFLSVDDGYNPAKTVEQARKLVEEEEVLLVFGMVGTAPSAAIQRYLNARKVPQLYLTSSAARFSDGKTYPWTLGWPPGLQSETRIYAQHILQTRPDAKIAILMQNDDFGKDSLKGFMDALGDKAKTMVVAQATYEISDPTIDSQIVALKASGADTFFNISSPKFAAQSIRKAAAIGWKPLQYLSGASMSIPSVMLPAGPENAVGVITSVYLREPTGDAVGKEVADYQAWMAKYYPQGQMEDSLNVLAHALSQTLVHVLRQAGDNLSRENVMKVAGNTLFVPDMVLPGIEVRTGPGDFSPVERLQLVRFNGKRYEAVGDVQGR